MEVKPIKNLKCCHCNYEGTDWELSIYENDIANSGVYVMWVSTDCPNCNKYISESMDNFEFNSRC